MDIITFRIDKIRFETPEAFTFFLKEVNGKPVEYRAGQFLTLLLNVNGKEVRRSYSISSAPGIDKDLSFTVKRVVNGEVSRYLMDRYKEGDLLKALPPAGRFVINDYNQKVFCFVAAGSGITPVYSLIKQLLNGHAHCNILLINQNRSEQTAIFRKELLLLQQGYSNRFSIIELFSQPADHTIPSRRLNNILFEQLIKQLVATQAVHFYLCGPSLFMHMAEFTLRMLKFPSSKIYKENFTVNPPPPPAFMIDTAPRNATIFYHQNKYEMQVKYPQSILQAALQHHIHLPYSCRGGRCSTCTLRLLEGKIKMSINDVLTEKDLQAGLILTCVGFAETDVILQVE